MSGDDKKTLLDSFEVGGKSGKRSKLRKSFEDEKGSSPIDESAQDEIASELRKDAERLNRNGRTIFCGLLFLVSGMYSLCLAYSFSHPFEMEHQLFFRAFVPLWGFHLFYAASAASFTACAIIVKHESVRKPLVINVLALISLAIGTFSAVFWISVMLSTEAASSHLMSLCWLPFSTLAGCMVTAYVDRDAGRLLMDVERVEGSKYSFKEL